MRRLLTIPLSHYCEKARWGLERAGLVYREEPHLQMLHWAPARRVGGGRTVPVLVTNDGVYTRSHEILVYADATMPKEWRLYPDTQRDEAYELERRLDREYGPQTQCLFYEALARAPRSFALSLNNQTAPKWESATMTVLLPVALTAVLRYFDIRPIALTRARDRVARTLDHVAARLKDGRLFLCGDQLTGADITFAALSAPLFAPRQYGVSLPRTEAFPDSVQDLFRAHAQHPAIHYADRLYLRERRRTIPFEADARP